MLVPFLGKETTADTGDHGRMQSGFGLHLLRRALAGCSPMTLISSDQVTSEDRPLVYMLTLQYN